MNVTEDTEALQWPDFLSIAAVLLISASIGIYYRFSGGRQKTAEEYFSANRSMNAPLLAVAMMVTSMSAIAMLGTSGETYSYGIMFMLVNVGYAIGTPIVALLYLPVFYNLQNMSIYEYLNTRFGPTARLAASLANFMQMTLGTGVVLFAPALALESTTGFSSALSVLLIGLICTFYSSIGGIKAVLATDVFQGGLMVFTVLYVSAIGCYDIEGGISAVWSAAIKSGRLNIMNFDLDPTVRHTWWTLLIGGACLHIGSFGANQNQVQRLLSARSLKTAQVSLYLCTPLMLFNGLAISLAGLVLYTWFDGCDPVASGRVSSFDQVMPYFAKIRLSQIPGLLGFFIAGVFSAALSTVSSSLNSLSAIAIADYIKPLCRTFGWKYADSKTTLYGKILCVVNGLISVAVAFLTSGLGNLIQTILSLNGAIGGPLLGLFSLGMFVESANETGALIGTVLSLVLLMWMTFGQPKPPIPELPVSIDGCANSTYFEGSIHQELLNSRNADGSDYFYLYRVSYMLYTPLGMATTMLFGFIASTVVRCFSKNPIEEPDPDLFSPIVAARMKRRRAAADKTTVR